MDDKEYSKNLQTVKALLASQTPVYLSDKLVSLYGVNATELPLIKTMKENYGVVIVADDYKFIIQYEGGHKHPGAKTGKETFPLDAVPYLIPKNEWESSDEFLSLSLRESRFSVGKLCYLSSSSSKPLGEANPKIGSSYERHGKIIDVVNNLNNTARKIKVRWFLSIDGSYDERELVTPEEFQTIQLNKVKKFTFRNEDALIQQDSFFVVENGYFKSTDDSIFLSVDTFDKLLKRS